MTQRQQNMLKWLLPIAVSVGASWGTLGADVHQKLDTARFERDSISRLPDHDILLRLDKRVGEMYCATIPDSLRTGCR